MHYGALRCITVYLVAGEGRQHQIPSVIHPRSGANRVLLWKRGDRSSKKGDLPFSDKGDLPFSQKREISLSLANREISLI